MDKQQARKRVRIEDVPEAVPLEYVLTSRGRKGWPCTVDVRRYREGFVGDGPAFNMHQIILNLEPHTVYTRSDGREQRGDLKTGEIGILPANLETFFDGAPGSSMGIFFSPALLDLAYEHISGRPRGAMSLPHILHREDPTLSRLSIILKDELVRPQHPAQIILVESVLSAMLLHLVREFAVQQPIIVRGQGLRPSQLAAVLEFIDGHAETCVSLTELAMASGISRFHFSRLFKETMGVSPMRYVERHRLQTARALIAAGRESLSHIAIATGYADQSHFSRRFKAVFGCTPAQFASQVLPKAIALPSRRN